MGTEIERKFLVTEEWQAAKERGPIDVSVFRQGYLSTDPARTVRVRLSGEQAWLTVKGKTRGTSRSEFEYAIPADDARQLLELCPPPLIEKRRYRIRDGQLTWEVDEFLGENAGLVLAEIELDAEDQEIALPEWVGPEVSHDHRYFNASLVRHPFREWSRGHGA